MTDLISSLADSILALVNSRPQTPSKAELEDLLSKHCFFAGHAWSLEDFHCVNCGEKATEIQKRAIERGMELGEDEEAEGDTQFTQCTDLNEASLERAIVVIQGMTSERQLKAQLKIAPPPETYTLSLAEIPSCTHSQWNPAQIAGVAIPLPLGNVDDIPKGTGAIFPLSEAPPNGWCIVSVAGSIMMCEKE